MNTYIKFFSLEHILIILISLVLFQIFIILHSKFKKLVKFYLYGLLIIFSIFYIALIFSPDLLYELYNPSINIVDTFIRLLSYISFTLIPYAMFSKYKFFKNFVYIIGSITSIYYLFNISNFKFNYSVPYYCYNYLISYIMLIGFTALPPVLIFSNLYIDIKENNYKLKFSWLSIINSILLSSCFILSFFPYNIFYYSSYLTDPNNFIWYPYNFWHLIVTLIFVVIFIYLFFILKIIKDREFKITFLSALLCLLSASFLNRGFFQASANGCLDISSFPIWACSLAAPFMSIALATRKQILLNCAYLFFLPGLIVTNLTVCDYEGINFFYVLPMIFLYHHYYATVIYILTYANIVNYDFKKYAIKSSYVLLLFFAFAFILGETCYCVTYYNNNATFFFDHITSGQIVGAGNPGNPFYILNSPLKEFTFLNFWNFRIFGFYLAPFYTLGFLFAYFVFGVMTYVTSITIKYACIKVKEKLKNCKKTKI